MSAGKDDIFTRWSRRKQAVREVEETASPVEGEGLPETTEPQSDSEPDPAEPLPRLEDLTPESGLAAFLRDGVPEALKSAAMRKMWSLDPAIRDYVGPSEYAWNFNEPGSMAGFGALADGGKSAAAFLSTMSQTARTRLEKLAVAGAHQRQEPAEEQNSPAREEADVASMEEEPPAPQPMETDRGSSPENSSLQAEPADPPDEPPSSRMRHGRATPR